MDSPWDSPQLLGSPVPWHPTKDSACGAASYQIARPHAVTYDNEAANPSLAGLHDCAQAASARRLSQATAHGRTWRRPAAGTRRRGHLSRGTCCELQASMVGQL